MTAKEKAKEIVNSFYQPLGYMIEFHNANSKRMWACAQSFAKTAVSLLLTDGGRTCYDQIIPKEQELNANLEWWQEVYNEIDNI